MRTIFAALCLALLTVSLWLAWLGCDNDAAGPVEKASSTNSTTTEDSSAVDGSFRFRDYPRMGLYPFDVLPVSTKYVRDSKYTGVTAPTTGPCHMLPLHSYRWSADTIGGRPTDTLRIDTWITTRCKAPGGRFTMMRLFLDMRSERFSQPVTVRFEWTHTSGIKKGGYFVWSKERTELIEDPSEWCPMPVPRYKISSSPYLQIEPLLSCRDNAEPDSLRLTLWLEPPVLKRGTHCLPNPTLLMTELTDPKEILTIRSPFYLGTCF